MLLATSSLQAAESAAKVVDVKIPLNSYMEGLQNEGVQELPSLVVFKATGECLKVIDTAKITEIAPQLNRAIGDGVIHCTVTPSKHFDKTGDISTPMATVHLQLVLLDASVCTLCPGYIDEVQKVLDARKDVRLVVIRVVTK